MGRRKVCGGIRSNPRRTMNTCDTCKWWGKGQWHAKPPEQSCGLLDSKINEHGDAAGYAVDKEGNQGFICGPKFGCIHWEAK